MGAETGIALMGRSERQVREAFHTSSALDPTRSLALAEMGLDESMALKRLQQKEVVRESSPGCYWFDDTMWDELRATRMRMAMMLLAAVVLTGLVGLYTVWANR